MMKVIKLDRRHTLYKDGFRYAFSGSWSVDHSVPIEQYLTRVYGHHEYDRDKQWYSMFSRTVRIATSPYGGTYKTKTYYIALRNEADTTACILAAGV